MNIHSIVSMRRGGKTLNGKERQVDARPGRCGVLCSAIYVHGGRGTPRKIAPVLESERKALRNRSELRPLAREMTDDRLERRFSSSSFFLSLPPLFPLFPPLSFLLSYLVFGEERLVNLGADVEERVAHPEDALLEGHFGIWKWEGGGESGQVEGGRGGQGRGRGRERRKEK